MAGRQGIARQREQEAASAISLATAPTCIDDCERKTLCDFTRQSGLVRRLLFDDPLIQPNASSIRLRMCCLTALQSWREYELVLCATCGVTFMELDAASVMIVHPNHADKNGSCRASKGSALFARSNDFPEIDVLRTSFGERRRYA